VHAATPARTIHPSREKNSSNVDRVLIAGRGNGGAAVLVGFGEDFGDIPVGVVGGEDRVVVVVSGARCAQAAGGAG
jgi:hypothetical protein